jgi:serine/threonine protein kinase
MFYEMLTGKKPYLASTPMAVIYKHSHAPLPELEPDISHLEPLTHRLLGKEPRDRYQSASQLLDAIDALNESPLRQAVAGE